MNVRLRVLFQPPTDEDRQDLRRLARELTNDPGSIRLVDDPDPGWLVVDFTMPTEPQYRAVERIDGLLRFSVPNRWDTTIGFLKTEAERDRARRKAERRRARRKEG